MENKKIIFFDGVCNLCNSAVNFVIKHDGANQFKFASLQSKAAESMLSRFPLPLDKKLEVNAMGTIVLWSGKRYYTKSSAALTIAKDLSGAYPLLYAFMIIPKFLRDAVYDYISRNRYNWFGKREECMVPTAELRAKFL